MEGGGTIGVVDDEARCFVLIERRGGNERDEQVGIGVRGSRAISVVVVVKIVIVVDMVRKGLHKRPRRLQPQNKALVVKRRANALHPEAGIRRDRCNAAARRARVSERCAAVVASTGLWASARGRVKVHDKRIRRAP